MSFINLTISQNTVEKMFEIYGVRIQDVGIEFVSLKDRENLLKILSRTNAVKINDASGIVHKEQDINFGLYIRNTKKQGVRCYECHKIFYDGECTKQEYEYPYSYNDTGLSTRDEFICISCLEQKKIAVAEIRKRNIEEKKKLGVE